MKTIDHYGDLTGKVVLVRAGLNAPFQNGAVVNDFRIRRALPTLRFLKEKRAKTIVIAHIGRDESDTLKPVYEELTKHIACSFTTRETLNVGALEECDTVLLENIRQDKREVQNDTSFARELARIADVFVQDAFAVCHREHASIVGIPQFVESYAGLSLKAEVEVLSRALTPERPSLFVLGGAKFATKEPLIRKALDEHDSVFIGGALQNELLAAKGVSVGKSVIEDGAVPEEILAHTHLLPVDDVVVARGDQYTVVHTSDIGDEDTIVDIGPASTRRVIDGIERYRTIVWNGPLGWYERGFTEATRTLAQAVGASRADVIIGGGDTVAVIQQANLESQFDFLSTGGGAMLAFLQNGTLPGIDALEK